MTFFLITTDHLEDRLWFRDDEDFKTGMNYAATVAFLLGVNVLAFILMSNHVHFVLACSEAEAPCSASHYLDHGARFSRNAAGSGCRGEAAGRGGYNKRGARVWAPLFGCYPFPPKLEEETDLDARRSERADVMGVPGQERQAVLGAV